MSLEKPFCLFEILKEVEGKRIILESQAIHYDKVRVEINVDLLSDYTPDEHDRYFSEIIRRMKIQNV